LKEVIGLDMRHPHQVDFARVGDNQASATTEAPFHNRGKDRMAFGGVRTNHEDHVGSRDRIEILGACRRAKRRLEAIAGWLMANARAGIDVIVTEGRAHQLLHEIGFLVGAS